MYGPINVFFPQQFFSFRWLLFPELLLVKSWKLHKLLKLTNSFTFAFNCACADAFHGLTRMLMSKDVDNNVIKDSRILFHNMRIYKASNRKSGWSLPPACLRSCDINLAGVPAVKTSMASFNSQQYPRHYRRLYRRWSAAHKWVYVTRRQKEEDSKTLVCDKRDRAIACMFCRYLHLTICFLVVNE